MEKMPTTKNHREQIYIHPEIGNLEADALALVEKLKDKIDQGFYTLLVSDETGGRLPTLLIRSIIKKRHPVAHIETLFLNGGKMLHMLINEDRPEEEASFVEYIKFVTEEHHNALVVTQVMRSGSSLAILASMLKQSGCEHVDVATIRSAFGDMIYNQDKERLGEGEMFIGKNHAYTNEFDDKNEELSGVAKVDGWVVHPHATRSIAVENKEERPLQATVHEARADITIMAERIYKKVWGQ